MFKNLILLILFIAQGCSVKNEKSIDYTCDFYYDTVMPESLKKIDKNIFYIGKGFSGRLYGGAVKQMNVARLDAESDLSNNISGYIESYIKKEDFHDFRTKQTYSTYKSTIKQTSNLLVKGAETIDWLDKKNCIYWSYKIVKKDSIEKMLKIQKVNYDRYSKMLYNIEQTNSQTLSKSKKLSFYKKSLSILKTIDFDFLVLSKIVPKNKSQDYYYQLLAKIKNDIDLKELVTFEKKKLFLLKARLGRLINQQNILKLDLDKLKTIELEAQGIHSSMLAQNKKDFIEELENIRKKYNNTIKINEQKRELQKIERYFKYAQNESKNKNNRYRNLEKAISLLESLDSRFIYNRDELLHKYKNYKKLLSDDVMRLVDIGMPISTVVRKLGKPSGRFYSLLWKSTSGYRYGNYWILVKNSLVQCIVESRGIGTSGAIGRYVRSCDWHMRNRRNYVVKSKYD